jgi:hypothetical protein
MDHLAVSIDLKCPRCQDCRSGLRLHIPVSGTGLAIDAISPDQSTKRGCPEMDWVRLLRPGD